MVRIKGWKLVRKGKKQIQWTNNGRNVLVDKHPKFGWRVFVDNLIILSRKGGFIENVSRTRAIKEAIMFMRSHPRG